MKNPFRITKLDRRHKGVEYFAYYIDYKVYVPSVTWSFASNCVNFSLARNWFWTTFGASCELNMFDLAWHIPNGLAVEWAWSTDNNNLRIYVTEPTLSHFMLAHSA